MNSLINKLQEKEVKAFTHGGKFHADDVFSSALLLYLNPEVTIQRGNRVPDDFDGIVYDIGRGEYDHHQNDSRIRENGVPFAAFGLLWEALGTEILSEELAARFDNDFVQPLDINDNTGERNELAALIGDFNPSWDEEGSNDDAFFEAVKLAGNVLENKFAKYRGNERADELAMQYMEQAENGVLVLPKFIPCQKKLTDTDIEFIIFPSNRGGYCLQPLKKPGSMNYKCDFPKEWLGLDGEDLQKESGLASSNFCHKGGFLMTLGELDDAVEACKISRNAYVSSSVVIYYRECSKEAPVDTAIKELEKKYTQMHTTEQIRIKTIDFPEMPQIVSDEKDGYYDVIDLDKEEWKSMQKSVLKKLMKYKPEAVIVDGNALMTYPIIHLLRKKHVPVLVPFRENEEVRLVRIPSGS